MSIARIRQRYTIDWRIITAITHFPPGVPPKVRSSSNTADERVLEADFSPLKKHTHFPNLVPTRRRPYFDTRRADGGYLCRQSNLTVLEFFFFLCFFFLVEFTIRCHLEQIVAIPLLFQEPLHLSTANSWHPFPNL